MNKIVINTCYGGFGLSALALKMLYELKNPGKELYFYRRVFESMQKLDKYYKISDLDNCVYYDAFSIDLGEEFSHHLGDNSDEIDNNYVWWNNLVESRHDPDLIRVVETLGEKANGPCANLEIVEIKENKYRIDEYDGYENIEIFPGGGWIEIK